MPQGSIHVSKPLTNVSVLYKNEEYIANEALPDVMVEKESDLYYVYNNDFRVEQTARANGSPANHATYDVSTSSYVLSEHALKDKITMRDKANVDAPMKLEIDTTEYLTDKIMLRQEALAHQLLFTTTSFGFNATLDTASSWVDNTTTSAPIQNVLSATSLILSRTGGRANVMITNQAVLDGLKENVNVYGRIQYVERAIMTKELLASVFDLDKILVGTAAFNQGKEGATVSMTTVWGSDALVAKIDPSPGIKTKTMGATLRQSISGKPYSVRKWFDDEINADWIEVSSIYSPRVIASQSAYLFKTAALI